MNDLIGRTRDLAALDAWMTGGGRIVTITGPPGAGKSRLAHEMTLRRPGIVTCDLTTCREGPDVERALQEALGVSRTRLPRVMAAGDVIVVLDPVEHLVAVARGLVEAWSRGGGRFVVVSREALGLASETTIHLGGLSEDEAIALYAARAGRPIEAPTAAAIVARLDRLPLAIELAAARAAVLPERELLARLDVGIGAIESRSSSLRATIRWSIDLLLPEERRALLACAVFRGPFDGPMAEEIAGDVGDRGAGGTVGSVVALERKSLLRRVTEGGGARVVLYDAVREVALEALTREGGRGAAAARHAAYFQRLADAWAAGGAAPEPYVAFDLLVAYEHLVSRDPLAAARIALAVDQALVGQTPSRGHVELLSSALASAEAAGDPVTTAKVLLARARVHRLLGAALRAKRDLRAALALVRRGGASVVLGDVLRLLGVVARQLSRPLRARVLLLRALAIHEALGETRAAAVVLDDLGVVAHDLGDLVLAREAYERALPLERVAGDRRFEGITLGHLGLVAHDLGDLARAESFHREALAIHRAIDDRRFEGLAHAFLAAVMLERGDVDAAERALSEASAIDARLGDVDSGALLAGIGCAVAAASGRIAPARELILRSRSDLAARDDDALRRALDLFALSVDVAEARRARTEGRDDDARARLERVHGALAEAGPPACIEERLARRVVGRLLDEECSGATRTLVADDGTWFESGGRRVSLRTRRALAGMLARLAREREVAPGRSVALDALFEAGWPGETVLEASARRRVYVGIDTLRSLGLRSAIVQRDRGYGLGSAVEVRPALNEV